MSLFSTPSPPSEAGGTGPAGGRPDFPSPTKLERNGLTGAELGAQMAAENLLKLSKQRGLTYSGKREEVVTFDYVVTNKFVTVFGDGAERLLHLNGKDGYSFSEWTNMGEWQRAYVQGIDRGMRDYLLSCISQDTQSGQTLMHEIISSDKGGAMGPGVKALLQYITSAAMSMTHSEAQVELMELKNKKICVNESAEEMRAKCADLRTKWLAIPEKFRGPEEGLCDALINLIPSACEEYKHTLVVQLDTRRGMDDPMPSYEALARTVVAGVIRYRLEHETNNINMTLAAGYGENYKCYNCGGDHKSWECSKKCTICETNFCGAPKGEPDKCPCNKKEMPPKDQVKNYNGKPIPEKLYTQLVATHQRLQKKATGETTLMLTDTWGGLTGNYRANGGNGYRGSSIW